MIDRKIIEKICRMDEEELRSYLVRTLKKKFNYQNVICTKDYIIAEGTLPICLVAHMDTVFSYLPQEFIYDQQKHILYGIGGSGFDDRAGICAILELLNLGNFPSVIFTTDEEMGGLGSRQLVEDYPICPFPCNAIIQLDRANHFDSVYYDCNNKQFEEYINDYGFETAWGTFSDISVLAPAWEIAAVNLSIGYKYEHSEAEILHLDWLNETINKVDSLLIEAIGMKVSYKYIPMKYSFKDETYENCIFCGRSFNERLHRNIITYPNFSYAVCDGCKKEYLS